MPRGSRTPIHAAAQAKALADTGYTSGQIARATGLPKSTVADIIAGKGAWGEITQSDQRFMSYRMEAKRQLQISGIELSKKALQQVEDKLPSASAAQAAVIYGVMRDKERLDAGEATQNISIHTREEILALDELAASLSRALLKRQTESD